jgi:hypothetical protein
MTPLDFDWYKIINRAQFVNLNLASRTVTLDLADRGLTEITVVRGVGVGFVVDEKFIRANLNQRNPFYFDGLAVYQDPAQDLWLGFERED